ncbi:HET-domain-containing protein [Moniliophthora roreri]|uniref:Heterokaryon incompatibility domain-containing protein n=1 Tax=Moniliophthora roreri TaxID=221103 RepID=A0A0W0ETN6_MONRR|nr:HET-domain-containing protein [Moniliophthora roreri]
MGETSSKIQAHPDETSTQLPSQPSEDAEPKPPGLPGCSPDDASGALCEVEGRSGGDKVVTGPLLSEEMKQKLFQDVLRTMSKSFHERLKRVGNMESILDSRDNAYEQERDSAPEFAQRMDGGIIAIEEMLKDSTSLFQDVIAKELFEAGKRAEEAGLRVETEELPKPLPIVPTPMAVVLTKPLSSLDNTIIDISGEALPCRFRLIDCAKLVHEETLQVIEYPDTQGIPYAVISYIWRGAIGPTAASFVKYGTFAVKGAEDGDPVSVDVLLHVCKAALLKNIPLLWLDRLCIIQTSRDDKVWQIQQMYRIYAECAECFILPGGTRRLVRLEEPTMWIHRGWTLQEAVAPRSASVVIHWEHGDGSFGNPEQRIGTSGSIEEIVPGQSAYIRLSSLVNASVAEDVEFRAVAPDTYRGRQVDVSIRIFGNDEEAGWRHAFALSAALKPVDDEVDPKATKKGQQFGGVLR